MTAKNSNNFRDPLPYPRLESDENFVGRQSLEVGLSINFFGTKLIKAINLEKAV